MAPGACLEGATCAGEHCADQVGCDACNEFSSLCHFCASDNKCHAKGSPYGCLVGQACPGTTCKEQKDCNACYENALNCHWCAADRRCHAKLSPYGCAVGATCKPDRCTRARAVPAAHGAPPAKVVVAAVMVVLCAACCGASCTWAFRQLREGAATTTLERDDRYFELSRLADEGASGSGRGSAPGSASGSASEQRLAVRDDQQRRREAALADDFVPRVERKRDHPLARCAHACARRCCCVATALVALLMLLACLFYPAWPEYNICNNALNWDSVLAELEQWEVGGSYTLLVSVRNRNRVGVRVRSAHADFVYPPGSAKASDVVGTWDFEPGARDTAQLEPVAPGTLSDFLMTVEFTPGVAKAREMYRGYQRGDLKFDVRMTGGGEVLLGTLGVYSFSETLTHTVDLHAAWATDLCKCPTGSPPAP